MGRAGGADARRWLLLDLAGVLLSFEPALRVRRIARESGLGEDEVMARLSAEGIGAQLDDGRADGVVLAGVLGALIGRAVAVEEAWEMWLAPFGPEPALLAELPDLARRWRVGVFTNNARAITRLFDAGAMEAMFFSSELGATKPDPAAYAAVERALGVEPATIRFVDDSEANVEAARIRGWDAVLYRPGDRLG